MHKTLIPTGFFSNVDRGLGRWMGELFEDLVPTSQSTATLRPSVDLFETPEAFRLEFDLPGVREEDVTVSIEDGVLDLRAERKRVERGEDAKARHVERRHECFVRRIHLGEGGLGHVDEDNVAATLDAGVLTITLPKAPSAQPRRIEVRPAAS